MALTLKSGLLTLAAPAVIAWFGMDGASGNGKASVHDVAGACKTASSACQREIKMGYEPRSLFMALSHDFF